MDWEAWNELMSRFGRLLLHTARSIGLNDSDAADVAQRTSLAAPGQVGADRLHAAAPASRRSARGDSTITDSTLPVAHG